MRYAVIMAGGAGTRLWPMSKKGQPKQLLRFIEGRSLLNIAAGRLRGLIEPQGVYICTGEAYRQQVLDDLAVLPTQQILGEPMGRDTANAVGFAAAVLAKRDPEASMAILTADHVITPIEVFQNALRTAFETVEKHPEYLVTFGITPTHPATGYGYVQRGEVLTETTGNRQQATGGGGSAAAAPVQHSAFSIQHFPVHRVKAFKEKPTLEKAKEYLASGDYAWNSGMFVWKARTVLEQLKQQLPASYAGLMEIAAAWDTPRQQDVLAKIYPTLPKISIDFAVMEKAPHVATIAMPIQWLDVGSWPSFGETLTPDAAGNRTSGATTLHLDSSNTLVVSDTDHLIATIGLKDMIVIHTAKGTLVCPASQAEKIKAVVEELQKKYGDKYV